MTPLRILLVLLLATFCLTTGCSDDPTAPSAKSPTRINVEVPWAATAFTSVVEQARHPLTPAAGPFVLQGFNKHYDFGLSALLISLQVTNTSDETHAGPISLTLLSLLPRGVILLDPPNGQPTFEFDFSDTDGMWSPGESTR